MIFKNNKKSNITVCVNTIEFTPMRIAINGFGRIGRAAFKVAMENEDIEIVAINDLADVPTLAHLLQYDTAYGIYHHEVSSGEGFIEVDGNRFTVLAVPKPSELPWKDLRIDVVLECTGRFVKDGAARAHIDAGAKKVVLSAPAKGGGGVETFLMGINHEEGKNSGDIVSNASCTTNCIGPVIEVLNRVFGVEKSLMTTVHSYTANQNIQDGPNNDLRRARAGAQNIVPTTTGAAIATTKAIPELSGKFDGLAIRVPTIVVSVADITAVLRSEVTVNDINNVLIEASQSERYSGILGVVNEPLVSSDFIGDTRSSVVDLGLTKVVGGNLVKVVSWYDNEWGYSNRLVELAKSIGS